MNPPLWIVLGLFAVGILYNLYLLIQIKVMLAQLKRSNVRAADKLAELDLLIEEAAMRRCELDKLKLKFYCPPPPLTVDEGIR